MKKTLITAAVAAVAVAAAVPVLAAPAAQTIRVTETSFRIALSAPPRAGATTFVVRNASKAPHDLWIRGGGKTVRTPVLMPGRTARVTLTLKKGVRYQAWCAVASHAKKGMSVSFVAR